MVHYHRNYVLRKGEKHFRDAESQSLVSEDINFSYYKKTRPKLYSFLFLTLLSCSFVLVPHFFRYSFTSSLLYFLGTENDISFIGMDGNAPCSSISYGAICCDRSSFRSDVCVMKGDVRTHSASSSVFLYNFRTANDNVSYVSKAVDGSIEESVQEFQREKIRPYTRKWETSVMDTIHELSLILKNGNSGNHNCDVYHDVPAVFFSTGGYTGNVYHEFNDGIIPLYITSQHLNKKVMFVILEYHNWWITKYGDILSQLSDYPAVDFSGDKQTHCFKEAIVGLRIHDELTVSPSMMQGNKSIVDFRNLLDRAYWPRIRGLIQEEEQEAKENTSLSPSLENILYIQKEVEGSGVKKPKLVIISRTGSRAITNEDLLVKMAEEIGFLVEVLIPDRTTELAKIYRALNSSDVMIGVHGAAMTHLLFLKPGSALIQVVPLGTVWAAENFYGDPARKLGLKYIKYEIHPKESSLYGKYNKNDPVLRDPRAITEKGWQYTKEIYLGGQNVTLDLRRFKKHLVRAYDYSISKINLLFHFHPQ